MYMENDYESKTYKVSMPMTLFLIFLVLKLTNTGIIGTLDWIWVISPLWIALVLRIILEIIVKLIEKW